MGFAKDFVHLLSTNFKVGFYWNGRSEKDVCGRLESVLARWSWEHVV